MNIYASNSTNGYVDKVRFTVFAHLRVHGKSYARAFPTLQEARAFLFTHNGDNGLTAMRLELRITADDLDNIGWSETLDEILSS